MATLKDLQLTYLDSFVIHWPQAVPSTGKNPTLRPNGCYPAHHSKSMINKFANVSTFQFSVWYDKVIAWIKECIKTPQFLDTMFPLDDEGFYSADMSSHYIETWKAMEKLVDEGLVRYIGLSNFNRTQGM